eukprot:TRINITY_DN25301_c0_g1_i3.p1 TRINITY_DN25301_c0_g1~~TRINITY_DN25301_c0_g1_i3.p1  ORF type:complete len:117 (+),score=8.59 TRINITY_DN25301_c0_g1_i3:18-368(+)
MLKDVEQTRRTHNPPEEDNTQLTKSSAVLQVWQNVQESLAASTHLRSRLLANFSRAVSICRRHADMERRLTCRTMEVAEAIAALEQPCECEREGGQPLQKRQRNSVSSGDAYSCSI